MCKISIGYILSHYSKLHEKFKNGNIDSNKEAAGTFMVWKGIVTPVGAPVAGLL